MFTADTKVLDVINDPAFGEYGRLLFPADRSMSDDLTLGNVGTFSHGTLMSILTAQSRLPII